MRPDPFCDGHVYLTRQLANKNHYPAIDVLQSVSRVMIDIVDDKHRKMAGDLSNILATYRKAEDLINIGAYVSGSNPEIDHAIRMIERVNGFLKQDIHEKIDFQQTKNQMEALFEKKEAGAVNPVW